MFQLKINGKSEGIFPLLGDALNHVHMAIEEDLISPVHAEKLTISIEKMENPNAN